MTYGEIRYRVLKEAPGVDLALLDGYLLDRYTAILDRLKWRRQDAEVVIVTVAPYTTGTLAVTLGSTALTLTSGTFTALMTGRTIRISDGDEWYEFTYVSATTGTLDRAYQGATDAAATYSIYQNIYPLPADCRILNAIASVEFGPLDKLSRAELNLTDPGRRASGPPRLFAPYMDNGSDPPAMQIELSPIPDAVYALPVSYTAELGAIAGTGTGVLPWVRSSALVAGATADALGHLKDYAASDRQETKYQGYVADMMRTESYNRGPQKIKIASWLTRDNALRSMRGSSPRNGRMP